MAYHCVAVYKVVGCADSKTVPSVILSICNNQRRLHKLCALFGDNLSLAVGAVVHMHNHNLCKVQSRDLHTACRREDRGGVTEYIVLNLLFARSISIWTPGI